MTKLQQRLAVAMLSLCIATAASAQPVVKGGAVLTRDGLSLYTFDNDVVGSGRSVCNPPCSGVFPPYLARPQDRAVPPFSLVRRDDGTTQWAHQGRPLYRFYADEKRGDQGGDGMNRKLWHIARP
jgi:predicted lipoprotein with Yx(FWY)xxD motif